MEIATTDAVVDGKFELVNESQFLVVERTRTRASKTNPRKRFDEKFLKELAGSVKDKGIVQPILMRPVAPTPEEPEDLEVVAGEQRWRASGIAGMTQIPVLIRKLSDQEAYEIQVLENLQRRDLHDLEEAEGFEQMMKRFGYTADQLAEKANKSKSYIYSSLKLLSLCEPARQAFYAEKITTSLALLIARIPGQKLQTQACNEISATDTTDAMPQRTAIAHIQRNFMTKLKDAPFDQKDALLVPDAGACTTCPKRSGNNQSEFPDVTNADVCTDTACFAAKRAACTANGIAKAKENGIKVITDSDAKKIFPHAHAHTNGNYELLDSTCLQDSKRRTFRQIAKAAGVNPIVVVHPTQEVIVEVLGEDDLKTALKDLGIGKASTMNEQEKEASKKAKLANQYHVELLTHVRANAQKGGLTLEDWQMIAAHALYRCDNNTMRKLLPFLGWDIGLAAYDGKAARAEKLKGLSAVELADIIFTVSLFSSSLVAVHYTNEAPELHAAAARHGVDAKGVKAAVTAEAKATAAPKAKVVAPPPKAEKKVAAATTLTKPAKGTASTKAKTSPPAKGKPKKAAPPSAAANPEAAKPALDAQDQPAYKEGYACLDMTALNPYPANEFEHDCWNVGRARRAEHERTAGAAEFELTPVAAPAEKPTQAKVTPAKAWPFKVPGTDSTATPKPKSKPAAKPAKPKAPVAATKGTAAKEAK